MSSVFRRILQRFLKPTYFVGKDLEGNKYYEYANANHGRPKRTVQYKRKDDMWTYIASGKRLPVQWHAWLTHTRSHPPSLEELKVDLERQHRVQANAAILVARDREERARLAQPLQNRPRVPEPRPGEALEPEQTQIEPPVHTAPNPVRDPWAEGKRGSDEPQSWTPVVVRRK